MTQVAIVGGGVVGMACAVAAAERGLAVTVLERRRRLGEEISARNSGVIHAGLYYPSSSIKAATCVEGREMLYAHCARWQVPQRQTGKLVVAVEPAQVAVLERLCEQGRANGAGELELLDGAEVMRREPAVRAVAALWSPRTGIVDAAGLVQSLAAALAKAGGDVALGTAVTRLERRGSIWRVQTVDGEGSPFVFDVPLVVNAAGLGAVEVARAAGIDVEAAGWRIHPCKGDYFAVSSRCRLPGCLVYPVPGAVGLGIHVTLDLGGRYRLGPDAEYVAVPHYLIDEKKAERFAGAVAPFVPDVTVEHLGPDFAGVRPKLQGPGDGFRDFVLEEGSGRGASGLINLIGIDSPGLTASLALAQRVATLLVAGV